MGDSLNFKMFFQVIAMLSLLRISTSSDIFYPARHSFPFNEEDNVIPGQFQNHQGPHQVSQALVPPEPSSYDLHSGADYSSSVDSRFPPSVHHSTEPFGAVDRHPTAFTDRENVLSDGHRNGAQLATGRKPVVSQTSLAGPPGSSYIPPPPLRSTPITINDNFDIGHHPSIPSIPSPHERKHTDPHFEHRPTQLTGSERAGTRSSVPPGSSRRQFNRNFVQHSSPPAEASSSDFGLSTPIGTANGPRDRNFRPHLSRPVVSSGDLSGFIVPKSSTQKPFDRDFRPQLPRPLSSSIPLQGSSIPNRSTLESFDGNFIQHPPASHGPLDHHSKIVPTVTQYRNQDALGRYNFGYDGDSSSRHETKDVDGTVRGSLGFALLSAQR